MNKKLVLGILIILLIIISVVVFFLNNEYQDENTLYLIEFGNTKLRFERYDYVLGQNQLVGVEKSLNNGKTYEKLTSAPITVSMKPKFVFLNEKIGFAISKSNLTKNNNYLGIKVTHDGGKTFINGIINYDNPNIEILTIEDVPYYENKLLMLPCSIYQVKEDKSGYENIDLIFVSSDNGLSWNLELPNDISLSLKKDTLTEKGATFIFKNDSDKEYLYGPEYFIEVKTNNKWVKIESEPVSWITVIYNLKAGEIKELNFDWSDMYGELSKGEYRLVKKVRASDDQYDIYGEFIIE